jgi:hypothetical protein
MFDRLGTRIEQRVPETPYSYQPDQRVNINLQFIGQEGSATGYIRGIASHVPGLLSVWIVELEQDLPNYPYSCITAPEVALSPARVAIQRYLLYYPRKDNQFPVTSG